MEEIWKDIAGYKGFYQVSNLGRIKSLCRKTLNSKGVYHTVGGRIMAPKKDPNGYLSIILSKNQVTKQERIHRLVALAFIDNPENKDLVNHMDGNKRNNVVTNLEWVTHSQNHKHAFRTGLRVPTDTSGSKNGRARVTEDIVRQIRFDFDNNMSQKDLIEKYNIPSSTITNIKLRHTWKCVK